MKKESIMALEFILSIYPELVVYSNKDTKNTIVEGIMLPGCLITELITFARLEKLHFYVTNDYKGATQFKMYKL